LTEFATRGGYEVTGVFTETASGTATVRAARNQVMALAQARKVDVILVTELSRWGRSTQDLLDVLGKLAAWKVSVVAMSGMTFELETPHGRMMATLLAGIAQFERDLISERVKSGLAAARARGKKLGRQPGQRPKADKLAPKVIEAVGAGRSYRWIAHDLAISKNTVMNIVKRYRENPLA
jgi:DNA invertase Pin-like site-specific DNA recombinase